MTRRLQFAHCGLSLAEILISMTLLSGLLLTLTMTTLKANVNTNSLSYRNRAVVELDSLYNTMRKHFQNASWIDENSYSDRIEFTTQDDSGNYVNIAYRLVVSGSGKILQYSPDKGATWQSPYSVSGDSAYLLPSNAEFQLCGYKNNCTRFVDDDGDANWDESDDSAVLASGPGSALAFPNQANKIKLANFTFTRVVGTPPVIRTWPDSIIRLSKLSISARTENYQNFLTQNTGFFSSAFNVRSIYYEPNHRALLTVGYTSSGTSYLYITDRDGVRLNMPNSRIDLTAFGQSAYEGVCMMPDGQIILGRLFATPTSYFVSLNPKTGRGTRFSIPLATYGLSSLDSLTCDPADSTYFYLYGETTGGDYVIKQVHATQGSVSGGVLIAKMGTTWTVPDVEARGFFIGPVSSTGAAGDFYVLSNWVQTGPPAFQSLHRIQRATPGSSTEYPITLSYIDTPAPAYVYGIAYDPDTNRFFVSTEDTDRIYEISLPLKVAQ